MHICWREEGKQRPAVLPLAKLHKLLVPKLDLLVSVGGSVSVVFSDLGVFLMEDVWHDVADPDKFVVFTLMLTSTILFLLLLVEPKR